MAGTVDRHGRRVEIRINSRAKNYILRRKGGMYVLTIPPMATGAKVYEVMDKLIAQYEVKYGNATETSKYHNGQVLEMFCGVTVTIVHERTGDELVRSLKSGNGYVIKVMSSRDLNDPAVEAPVEKHVTQIARFFAKSILIKEAHEVSAILNVHPKSWKVSTAKRREGSCSARGDISLSCMLMYKSLESARHTICHELAHLKHFDHSTEFHRLCDEYCRKVTGKGEKELKRTK